MRQRIAFISEHASPLATLGGVDSGGQNVYVDQVSKNLARLGYEVDIFTRWDNLKLPPVVDYQKHVRVIHVKAGPVRFVRKEDMLPYMKEFTKNMMAFIAKHPLNYQLIHANFFMSALVAADLKRQTGTPFVVTFHALGRVRREHQGEEDEFADERFAIEERIVEEADRIIAECPQDREDLIFFYGANQDKISIVPCGYDRNEFYPIDRQLSRMTLNLPVNGPIILQLGRMVRRKGIDNVIRALGILHKRDDIQARLVVVGGESDEPDPEMTPEIGRLQEIAKAENVYDFVTFVGRKNRDQLKYYYNATDVFVSTPWYEPFGITLLEAMACGVPVVGANVGGIKFTVSDGKTGFLVPPKEPELLADRLKGILGNANLARLMRENATKRVNTFFTWAIVARSLAAIYEEVLTANHDAYEEYETQTGIISDNFRSLHETVKKAKRTLQAPILEASRVISDAFQKGRKVLVCGNGGSAAEAEHLAAELVGHFMLEDREALPALALSANSPVFSALANDYGYAQVFARQVEAYGREGDILVGISTSGNSENVVRAFRKASQKGLISVGILGNNGGKALSHTDVGIVVPSPNPQRVQEIHLAVIHTIAELVEKQIFPGQHKANSNGLKRKGEDYG